MTAYIKPNISNTQVYISIVFVALQVRIAFTLICVKGLVLEMVYFWLQCWDRWLLFSNSET